ncbi:LOW QUALITY PROTEIN: reverse transcriptase [Phytophthora megakarya]|uniref:Reverse transcriptase n=1 Tax=Phytophthora megakarya TaxID=4795 RepID=A0A225UKE4_9STRA|nr:LOW QUALITY PROTEIN: reverse transcriptase [Phytophthora megakarya]
MGLRPGTNYVRTRTRCYTDYDTGISLLPKSEFGKLTIPFLSHGVSADGIRALPKIVKGIEDLPFPSTYKGVQSFLGSLNYCNKFIGDLPVVAAVRYELDEERERAGRNLEAAKKCGGLAGNAGRE